MSWSSPAWLPVCASWTLAASIITALEQLSLIILLVAYANNMHYILLLVVRRYQRVVNHKRDGRANTMRLRDMRFYDCVCVVAALASA